MKTNQVFCLFLTTVKKPGDSAEDHESRTLLNKFLGASALLTGVESALKSEGNSGSSKKVSDFSLSVIV